MWRIHLKLLFAERAIVFMLCPSVHALLAGKFLTLIAFLWEIYDKFADTALEVGVKRLL